MTARPPGVDSDVLAMWSPALARGLIRDDAMRSMRYRDGYTDLLTHREPRRTKGSAAVISLCARARRAAVCALLRVGGVPIHVVREWVQAGLAADGEERVLDVACGPGQDTAFLAAQLDGTGFVIGVDDSVTMMRRAVRANSGLHAVYMHADTRSLPFHDGAFDVVSCLSGLHLSEEPMAVLHAMVRVLAPGGRLAVMTSCSGESALARAGIELAAAMCGVRVFDRTTIPAFLTAAGLTDIEQHMRGISQFVTARRPAPPTEINADRARPAAAISRR